MEKFGDYYPGDPDPYSKFKLRRYNIGSLSDMPLQIEDNSNGGWVKWEDVEPLLQAYLATLTEGIVGLEKQISKKLSDFEGH